MCDDKIEEIVYAEYAILAKALKEAPNIVNEFERCPCGSSLIRIIREEEKDGDDHLFICSKCGNYMGGLFNRLKIPPPEVCMTCKNKEKRWDEEPCLFCKIPGDKYDVFTGYEHINKEEEK